MFGIISLYPDPRVGHQRLAVIAAADINRLLKVNEDLKFATAVSLKDSVNLEQSIQSDEKIITIIADISDIKPEELHLYQQFLENIVTNRNKKDYSTLVYTGSNYNKCTETLLFGALRYQSAFEVTEDVHGHYRVIRSKIHRHGESVCIEDMIAIN